MVLLAKDKIGHDQLRKLSSRAWRRSYFKNMMRCPTYQEDLIEIVGENPGHLIATTACLGGYMGSMFLSGQSEKIDRYLEFMVSVFGKENFFIEIQPSFQKDQINFNKFAIEKYWDSYPFIFTTDSHYLKKEDRKIHRWFLQSKDGEREVDEFYSAAYMMGIDEVRMHMDYIEESKFNQMRDNTNLIWEQIEEYDLDHIQIVPKVIYEPDKLNIDKIKVVYEMMRDYISKYPYLHKYIETEDEADAYLGYLMMEGWYDKLWEDDSLSIETRLERLDYEFEQIYKISKQINQSLSDYFITMAKIIDIGWSEGDSIFGPARGSAGSSLIAYLIGITQVDPLTQGVELPFWRFIHESRPGLPDIDVDSESTKRTKIYNKLKEYFNSIGSDIINVCTFGTLGSKKSIQTAARALNIDDSVVAYLNSTIPNERGFDLSLSQCYYGDENHKPIKGFVEEMDRNPDLWELVQGIEGLVVQLGVHASGILVLNGDVAQFNSLMKTSKGVLVSAYDLDDSEQLGGLKYDLLTVQALDKIRATMNYLLEDGVIEWQGSLRETYNKYLLPKNLDLTTPEMWEKVAKNEIVDLFQFDTAVGSQGIALIKPKSLTELAAANSLMRLMADEGSELPLNIYAKHKEDINIWYREMQIHGLNSEEIKVLEKHLLPLYGVADSQEVAMLLAMDKNIAGFDVAEANSLRKAIAKKKADVLEETKQMFFKKGKEIGTRQEMLDYVWYVQLARQFG